MKLYGSYTSPFVRRVRVVAGEIGVDHELINTATDEGQATLRKLSPIWKVPVAEIAGRLIYDSRVIIDWLTTCHGWGPLRPPSDRWREANLVNAIDATAESGILLFYLKRDGLDASKLPFGQRQIDRITAIFEWLARELGKDGFGSGLGLSELSLLATLEWMEFRDIYPVSRHEAGFASLRAEYSERPSLIATRPFAP